MTQIITVHGGLTAEPELRFTSSGTPFLTGTVASSDRVQQDGKWVDGKDKLYLRFTAWGPLAENINQSALPKGCRVVVTGKLLTNEYQDKEGNKRSSTELKVTDFAVSLKHATATPMKTNPQGAQGGAWGGGNAQGGVSGGWPDSGASTGGFGGGFTDEESQPF